MNAAMRATLWTVFTACLAVNVAASLLMGDSALQLTLSVMAGACALGAGVGLWTTRRAR
ncbi:hypothetical protein AB0I22_07360 [Streptomyces sp. NPDC050610]|uniref:hypothetical protein n=1 Tax=Streptomyces sp. NPDC050610 TaxID=3157097 RepID=UPI003438A238